MWQSPVLYLFFLLYFANIRFSALSLIRIHHSKLTLIIPMRPTTCPSPLSPPASPPLHTHSVPPALQVSWQQPDRNRVKPFLPVFSNFGHFQAYSCFSPMTLALLIFELLEKARLLYWTQLWNRNIDIFRTRNWSWKLLSLDFQCSIERTCISRCRVAQKLKNCFQNFF